jgi:hypothetical protein
MEYVCLSSGDSTRLLDIGGWRYKRPLPLDCKFEYNRPGTSQVGPESVLGLSW